MQFTWVLNKTYSSCIIPSHQVLENHELHLTDTKIDAHFIEMQSVVAAELTRLTQKVIILLYIVAEICIIAILGSSSESGTSLYTFIQLQGQITENAWNCSASKVFFATKITSHVFQRLNVRNK